MDWISFLLVYRFIVYANSIPVSVLQLGSNTMHDTLKNIKKTFLKSFPVWKSHFSDAKSSDKQVY